MSAVDTTPVQVVSRAAVSIRMTVRGDPRQYVLAPRAITVVPRDFLMRWVEANGDAEVLNLITFDGAPEWFGKKRPSAREIGGATDLRS